MILDFIRDKYPELGLSVFAMEPGAVVTLETYAPDGSIFSFTAPTVAECIAKAFPELVHVTCPNTGLPCLPGCDRSTCAGLLVPDNEWAIPVTVLRTSETVHNKPAPSVFD